MGRLARCAFSCFATLAWLTPEPDQVVIDLDREIASPAHSLATVSVLDRFARTARDMQDAAAKVREELGGLLFTGPIDVNF